MSRLATHHFKPGEFLAARRALQIPGRTVLNNPLDNTLHQAAPPTFAVAVQQGLASGAMDRDGAHVLTSH
jgi:hypothetical protein